MSYWQPCPRYPEPAVQAPDPAFDTLVLFNASVEQLARAAAGTRGPSGWATCARCSKATSRTAVTSARTRRLARSQCFAVPCLRDTNTHNSIGRRAIYEHGGRRVIGAEHDGRITVLADHFGETG